MWGSLIKRRVTRRRIREDVPNLLGVGRETRKGHCLDISRKLKTFESQPWTSTSPLSPPLVTPHTESFFDGFPELSGVRRERSTDSTLPTLYARQLMGAADEKGLFGEGKKNLLGATAEAGSTTWRISRARGGYQTTPVSWAERGEVTGQETEMETQRGGLLHTLHTVSCSQDAALKHRTRHTWMFDKLKSLHNTDSVDLGLSWVTAVRTWGFKLCPYKPQQES